MFLPFLNSVSIPQAGIRPFSRWLAPAIATEYEWFQSLKREFGHLADATGSTRKRHCEVSIPQAGIRPFSRRFLLSREPSTTGVSIPQAGIRPFSPQASLPTIKRLPNVSIPQAGIRPFSPGRKGIQRRRIRIVSIPQAGIRPFSRCLVFRQLHDYLPFQSLKREFGHLAPYETVVTIEAIMFQSLKREFGHLAGGIDVCGAKHDHVSIPQAGIRPFSLIRRGCLHRDWRMVSIPQAGIRPFSRRMRHTKPYPQRSRVSIPQAGIRPFSRCQC